MVFSLNLANARKTQEGIVTNSMIYFTAVAPSFPEGPGSPAPLKLRKLMDLVRKNCQKTT